MAGEWAYVRQLFAGLDLAGLDELSQRWADFSAVFGDIEQAYDGYGSRLFDSGLEGELANSLFQNSYTTVSELGNARWDADSVRRHLSELASSLRELKREFEEADADYPVALSGDPDARLEQEVRINRFDAIASTWVGRMMYFFSPVPRGVEAVRLDWNSALPQADPAADPASVGSR